jgi:hypothetical protein
MNMDMKAAYKKNSITDFIYRIRKHPDFSKAFVHLKHIPAVELLMENRSISIAN